MSFVSPEGTVVNSRGREPLLFHISWSDEMPDDLAILSIFSSPGVYAWGKETILFFFPISPFRGHSLLLRACFSLPPLKGLKRNINDTSRSQA